MERPYCIQVYIGRVLLEKLDKLIGKGNRSKFFRRKAKKRVEKGYLLKDKDDID